MKICMLMKDYDYCKVLAETITKMGKDIVVEIGGPKGMSGNYDIILTDIDTDFSSIRTCSVVCLTNNPKDDLPVDYQGGYVRIFKYKNTSNILSDIEHIYYISSGNRNTYGLTTRVFAVCADFYDKKIHFSKLLAKQIYFRKGGEIIVVPLNYLNNYPCLDEKDRSKFSRWMYYMDAGKDYSLNYFTYSDSYGIDYLKLPPGLNPLSYLSDKNIEKIILELSHRKYETLILDICNCYSKQNIEMMKYVDNIIYFYEDENRLNINDVIPEGLKDRLKTISISNRTQDIDLILDNYVRKIYSEKGNESGENEEINSESV